MFSLNEYRVVDLSAEVHPGVFRINGDYTWGRESRKYEIREFIAAHDRMLMHWVDTETHIGTHVEVPSHLGKGGKSCGEMPVESFLGEAVVLGFASLKPVDGQGQAIMPAHLGKVRDGDVALMWSPYSDNASPYISPEAAACLAEKHIRMLGVQNVSPDDPRAYVVGSSIRAATHETMLGNGIPVVENLVKLETLQKERVFFIALAMKVFDLEASWVRAVALEPR